MCGYTYTPYTTWHGAQLSKGYIFMAWYLVKHRSNFTFTLMMVTPFSLVQISDHLRSIHKCSCHFWYWGDICTYGREESVCEEFVWCLFIWSRTFCSSVMVFYISLHACQSGIGNCMLKDWNHPSNDVIHHFSLSFCVLETFSVYLNKIIVKEFTLQYAVTYCYS
jgi:hypothetical protein